MTSSAQARFKEVLKSFSAMPEDRVSELASVMREMDLNKGEILLREGQVCKQFYFILKGYMRSFRRNNGKEVNVKFYFEDDFASDFESFRSEKPSKLYLVVMEKASVLCGTKTEVKPLLESDISFYSFVFRFFQSHYFEETEHSDSFKLMSPEERYKLLVKHKPHYVQRIPLTHLASYLGISRETLSRIRKKITQSSFCDVCRSIFSSA
jgi:CRP-like cAMP-binding protein